MKIGINGFGRIGRYVTRLALNNSKIETIVINDLAPIETLAHLFKYDSVHGKMNLAFTLQGNTLVFENGKTLTFYQEREPAQIPWGKHEVELVVEATGLFLDREKATQHVRDSVRKVILSAPAKDEDIKTIVLGVNDNLISEDDTLISNASCTTNSAAPMVEVIKNLVEIENAYITTIHSYTTDQRLHDSPHKDLRRARAANLSIVPTSTGAAKAITRIFPELEGKMGGCGMRVPVPDGSLTDLTLIVKKPISVEEINAAFLKASEENMKGIIEYTTDPIVSIDIVGNPHSVIFDSSLTSVIGNMVKLVGWYDNEAGYSNRILDLIEKMY
jgi:glyceraldehyde 3-phosphate dehydrogenase